MVSFQTLTKAQYAAIAEPVVDRIYYISDTGEQFLNGLPYDGEDNRDYLCLTAVAADSKVCLMKSGTDMPDLDLEYSTDKRNWTRYAWDGTAGTLIALANVGDKVYFRGDNQTFTQSSSKWYRFWLKGTVNPSGNIMSLIDRTCEAMKIPDTGGRFFYTLFQGESVTGPDGTNCDHAITDISGLRLPATELAEYCYGSMFGSQHLLVNGAVSLPATVMKANCYRGMFTECHTLLYPPELPALVLAERCYSIMFRNCDALTKAPKLPAKVLATNCYQEMFTSNMGGQSLLAEVEVGFEDWGSATTNWLSGISSTGVFKCPSALDTTTRDASHIPAGWTVTYTDVEASKIPTDNSQLTNGAGYVAAGDLATVAFTGDYNDLGNLPVIPTDNSELSNGMGYQTSADVEGTVSTEIATLQANNQLVPTPQSYSVLGYTRPVQTEAKQLRWSYSFDPGACLWLEAIDSPVSISATLVAGSSDTQTVDLWWSTNGVLWQKNTIPADWTGDFGIGLQNCYQDSGNGTFSKRIYLWKAEANSRTKYLTLRTSNSVRVGGNLDSMTSTSTKTSGPAYEFYRLLRDVKVSEFDQLVLPDRPLRDHALSECFATQGTVGNDDHGIPLSPMIPVRSDHAATAFENFWYDPNGNAGLQVSTVRFFNRATSQAIVGGSADDGADQYGTPLPAYRNMGPQCIRGIVELYGPSDTAIDIAHVFKSSAYYATRCVGMGEQKFVRERGARTSENLKSYAGYLYKLAVAAGGTLTLGLDGLTRFNTASQGYVEAIIDCDATGTVAFGTGFGSNNDAVVQGKRNHCVVRVTQGVGRLFVVDTEDIPSA